MPERSISSSQRANLGDVLVQMGVISQAQLKDVLPLCAPDQKDLGQVLAAKGLATEEQILKAISVRWGVPYLLNFDGILQPETAKLVPESLARKHLLVPILRSDDSITVGMVRPLDLPAIDEVSAHTGLLVRPILTTLSNLFDTVQKVYGAGAPAAPPAAAGKKASAPAEDQSVIETINALLQEGLARKASDIHLEPAERETRIRFRVDGMLQEGRTFPKDVESALVARIKILSRLDITETRMPQDGHMSFEYGDRRIDLRVSTLPIVYGEKVVLRILDSTQTLKQLQELGFPRGILDSFSQVLKQPNGMILVTGPTGSGKTTTLYAAIARRNEVTQNIVTLEDPVEYRIDRINQMETNPKIGLTFAAGLRSILRQDPNIILVGEIRDVETAEIAIQAAITGHMVLSTLHTNDTITAIHRLINMRIEPFLIASAVSGVMAQRLVRRLCEKCRKPSSPSQVELEALTDSPPAGGRYFEAGGCDACFDTGYRGRTAVYEWLPMTRALRELILKKGSLDELRAAGKTAGIATLRQDALAKAAEGITTIAEVVRVTLPESEG